MSISKSNLLILLTIFLPLFSLIIDFTFFHGLDTDLFSRSGALLICVSLIRTLNKIKDDIQRDSEKSPEESDDIPPISPEVEKALLEADKKVGIQIEKVETTMLIFGTILWAYGNLAIRIIQESFTF